MATTFLSDSKAVLGANSVPSHARIGFLTTVAPAYCGRCCISVPPSPARDDHDDELESLHVQVTDLLTALREGSLTYEDVADSP